MKQREYTKEQLTVMKVLSRFELYTHNDNLIQREIKHIKEDYGIKEPYLTLREYINKYCHGAYHTFHFILDNKEISIDTIGDMLTDEWCSLYPLTNKYYVADDNQKTQGANCENYHCDHYLTHKERINWVCGLYQSGGNAIKQLDLFKDEED